MPYFEPDPVFPPRHPYPTRGGARPGAGAPKGNLNAVKHGAYSRQMEALTLRIARDPEVVRLLRGLAQAARRNRRFAAGNNPEKSPESKLKGEVIF